MAVIKLTVVVPNLTTVLETFDVIKIYRSINGEDGDYTELTGPTTRIALAVGQTTYEYTDLAGDADYYYKSTFYHSTSSLESSLSDAQQGEGDPALDIISVQELKDFFLFGLDLTNDKGTDYPTSMYEHFIRSAVSWLEHRLDIPITPLDIAEEKHDFYREDYRQWMWLQLDHSPVISVESVSLVLPGEQLVQTFTDDWLHLQADSGQLQLVPGTAVTGALLLGASQAWLPLLRMTQRMVPDVFRVKYVAGLSTIPPAIKDLVGKIASFGPLNVAGDLLGGAGIASQNISIDGLSTGFNTTSSSTSAGYGARLIQYQKEIKEVVPTLQRYYKGIRMTVV